MGDWGRRLVVDVAFDRVVSTALEELEREGFKLLGRLDVREGLWQLLREDFRRYTILTVWHPAVASEALRQSLEIGVELPINVAIYELADRETVIVAAEPFPGLSGDRPWREQCLELLPIEAAFSEHLAQALDRMSHRARAMAASA